jgi:hypothetical protein
MKKLLVMAAVTVAATTAFAGVKLVVRSDYVNTQPYDSAQTAAGEINGTSQFKPEVARLYLSGMIGDATIDSGLNLRQFVIGTGDGTSQKLMTVDKFVEHLTISKPMGDFTFQAGKMWMNVGGFERRAFYDGDTYLTSLANGGKGGAVAAAPRGLGGSVVTPENMSGVGVAYAINAEHKLEFQIANQTNADSELVTASNNRHTMGLAYWGSFAEKMVQTYISYTLGAADTKTTTTPVNTADGHEQTFIGAGFRITPMENLSFDLEYLANSDKSANTDTKDETTSTFIEARYKMGAWTPLVKYEMSTDKVADNDNFKREAFAIGVEMVPKAEDAFRYHIAYTSIKDKDFQTAGFEDATQNMITVGFKYVGDIAK